MRTGLVVSVVILVLVAVLGFFSQQFIATLGEKYQGAARELLALQEAGDWGRLMETASAYRDAWTQTAPRVRMLIHHEDVDAIALALSEIQASALTRSAPDCAIGCCHLEAAAERMMAHDQMCLDNLL